MDFGLAKPASLGAAGSGSAPLLSAARTMSGPTPVSPLTTPQHCRHHSYMSPEQIEGKEADARSDIFCLRAVLYEMAMGKRAFEGKSQISVASAISGKRSRAISATETPTPVAFDYLVAACLAKDREDPFQSAHDVRLQLKRDCPIAATPPPSRHPAARRLGPRLPSMGGAVLLAVAVIIFYLSQRANAPRFLYAPTSRLRRKPHSAPRASTQAQSWSPPTARRLPSPRRRQGPHQPLAPTARRPASHHASWHRRRGHAFLVPDSHYLAFVADRQLKKDQHFRRRGPDTPPKLSLVVAAMESGRHHPFL